MGYLTLLQRYVDNVSEREADGNISEMDYTRNLVYEPVTDVGAMLGGAFEKVSGVYSLRFYKNVSSFPSRSSR